MVQIIKLQERLINQPKQFRNNNCIVIIQMGVDIIFLDVPMWLSVNRELFYEDNCGNNMAWWY